MQPSIHAEKIPWELKFQILITIMSRNFYNLLEFNEPEFKYFELD